jgi:hypothetical protein
MRVRVVKSGAKEGGSGKGDNRGLDLSRFGGVCRCDLLQLWNT